jgi:hypothetical protein
MGMKCVVLEKPGQYTEGASNEESHVGDVVGSCRFFGDGTGG